MTLCPCGSGKTEAACCDRFIEGDKLPDTPEELMRSRYTAYVRLKLNYIAATMKGPAANHLNAEEALQWASQLTWLGLEVLSTQAKGNLGWVEFKAYYEERGEKCCLHERSQFRLEERRWYYIDGHRPKNRISRNEPCPCGSLKKYKKCCLDS